MSKFSDSNEERVANLLFNIKDYGFTADDLLTINAMRDIAALARWILAHANENCGVVRLCMTANNPRNFPVEELFIKMMEQNPL